jgi:hypothetical protein
VVEIPVFLHLGRNYRLRVRHLDVSACQPNRGKESIAILHIAGAHNSEIALAVVGEPYGLPDGRKAWEYVIGSAKNRFVSVAAGTWNKHPDFHQVLPSEV